MEVNVLVGVSFVSAELRNFTELMAGDSLDKPILEDDVPPAQRPWFLILDEIETADSCESLGERGLLLSYMLGGYAWVDDLETVLLQLAALEVEGVAAVSIADGGEAEFWQIEAGRVVRCGQWTGKPVTAWPRGDDEGKALLTSFLAGG